MWYSLDMGLIDDVTEKVEEAKKENEKRKLRGITDEVDAGNPESAQAYEYKFIDVGSEGSFGLSKTSEKPEKKLNFLGVEGWDLVEQINMENGATQALIFQRPISDERSDAIAEKLTQD
jgi:hypothetical protein